MIGTGFRDAVYGRRAMADTTRSKITSSLRDLDLERHLSDPALRQSYVTPMFDVIAPRYDAFTRVFSFGMDRGWKNTLIAIARDAIAGDGVVADLATGTGDIAFALARVRPDLSIAAIDLSPAMLELALAHRTGQRARVAIATGDIGALPFPDESLDAIMAGYALRNTPEWRASVSELARVMQPGGHLLTLDFYQPAWAPWRYVFLGWLAVAGRAVGWWWHREPMAYGYIARSIAHFTTADAFSEALEASGFTVLATQRRLGGGIVLHHAMRRPAHPA
jgi:demethylmenaquinone methyltransferase/2-methoxy-6-polyprenyl-1,4-benzoquinol methylase